MPKLSSRTITRSRRSRIAPSIFGSQEKIIYKPAFRKFLKEHKGVIKNFLTLRRVLKRTNLQSCTLDEVTVQKLFGGSANSGVYKVNVGRKTFFVKEIRKSKLHTLPIRNYFNATTDLATQQVQALENAQKILRGKISNVEVAKWHLAFVSPNSSFLVTEFYEGMLINDLEGVPFELAVKTHAIIDKNLEKNHLGDANWGNIMWCPKLGKYILFDVRDYAINHNKALGEHSQN